MTDRSGRFGLTLVNDSKYGYDVLGSTLRLSLLRAPKYPDPEADIGEHRFAYALYPHEGDWKAARSHRRGAEFNLPLVPFVTERSAGSLPPEQVLVAVDADHVVVSALKAVRKRADRPAFAVRLVEVEGRASAATIELPFALAEAWIANLMEDRQERLPVDGRRVEVTIGPHQLKTIVVRPAN